MNNNPVWQLPVRDNGDGYDGIKSNAKYHCFIDTVSLCDKYTQDTDSYDTGIDSGEIAMRPEIACKICRTKWIKQYNIYG